MERMNESLLGQVPLFATLPHEEVQRLVATLRRLELPGHSILFREGEHGDRFFIVLDGSVEIVKALGTADERLLGVRGPGEFVGEMSLVSLDERRTATVRSRATAQLLEMTRAEFDALLRRQPSLAYHLVRVLSARLSESEDATLRDLHEKNRQLTLAYQDLQAAQAQIVEKETLERELKVARTIQESMLPRALPRLQGFDFGARMMPARAVGGDFFDFIPLDDDSIGIVVGDVSGKGVPAALFMALTRSLVRAEASRNVTPRQALQTVNRHLLGMNEARMFVTVTYGVLYRRTSEFVYARAGHELPLLVDRAGDVTVPALGLGNPLGVFEDPSLDEQSIALPPFGSLLLYTDGVTEALDQHGRFFGMRRLSATLGAACGASAQGVCERVLEAVVAHQGRVPQYDDVTLVAVHSAGDDGERV
jgi:serine phosphatase RsbU (regulator of sigma subunit)